MNEFYNTKTGKKLLLHAGLDAANRAFAYFDDESVTISDPTGTSSIRVAKDYGVSIQGPLSIIASPEQVRFATMWKINPLVLSALPSTVYTPIPWLRQSIPMSYKEAIKGLSDVMRLFV